MLYVIHAEDHPDAIETRLAYYDKHKSYLKQSNVKSLISGPLVADDGETMIGSLFIVEAQSREEVMAFNENDPFAKAGVWSQVKIHSFLKRVDNR